MPDRHFLVALLVSAAAHLMFIGFSGSGPRTALRDSRLSARIEIPAPSAAVRATERKPDIAETPRQAPRRSGDEASTRRAAPRVPADQPLRRSPPEGGVLPFVAATPVEYFTPSQVDRLAVPVDPDLLDLLPLTGDLPATWLVRLYVGADGRLEEVQVLETEAPERTTNELKTLLLTIPFIPASKLDKAVRSQKMLEISFDPSKGPRMTPPVLIPSAAEK